MSASWPTSCSATAGSFSGRRRCRARAPVGASGRQWASVHETEDEAALLLAVAGIGRAADLGAVDCAAMEGVLVLGPDQDELIAVAAPGSLSLALGPVAAGEGAVRPEGV